MFKRLKLSRAVQGKTPMPDQLRAFVPEADGRQPWVQLEGGDIVVAGAHSLMLVGPGGVKDSGLWHEVQYSKWDAATKTLQVIWIQPERLPLSETTISDDPKALMEAVTARVERTIVATRSFYTGAGVRVSASVRRRVDGQLFSSIVTDGPLRDDDRAKAETLEDQLRFELGLEE